MVHNEESEWTIAPISCQADEGLNSSEVSTPTKNQKAVKPIEKDEMRTEKKEDSLCRRHAALAKGDKTRFHLQPNGLLVRKFPRDGATQVFVPESVQPRILYLVHYPLLAGNPQGSKMYDNLRRKNYWP